MINLALYYLEQQQMIIFSKKLFLVLSFEHTMKLVKNVIDQSEDSPLPAIGTQTNNLVLNKIGQIVESSFFTTKKEIGWGNRNNYYYFREKRNKAETFDGILQNGVDNLKFSLLRKANIEVNQNRVRGRYFSLGIYI